ncbi:MAG: hypothetical protein Q9224_007396 [Gallowayella concinna]
MAPTIQPATSHHLPSCLYIYNHYALHTIVTFHTTAQPLSFLSSTLEATSKASLPFFVAVDSELSEHSGRDEQEHWKRENSDKKKEANTEQENIEDEAKASKKTSEESNVLGYTYALPYRPHRPAYAPAAEFTIMLSPTATGRGVGPQLLSALLEDLRLRNGRMRSAISSAPAYTEGEIKEIIAMVAMEQSDCIGEGKRAAKFYEREGFRKVGVLQGVGWKFGRKVDVGVLQKGVGG